MSESSSKNSNAAAIPAKVVVIDSDKSNAHQIEAILQTMGVPQTEIQADGDAGLAAIRSGVFSAAIIDLKLAGSISAFALLCRIRRTPELVHFPIVFTTGLQKRDEMIMLQEFQCIQMVEKPLRKASLNEALKATSAEKRWYQTYEKKIADAFESASFDMKSAVASIGQILTTSPNPTPLAMIAAKHLINQGYLNQAIDIYDDILRRDAKNLIAINAKAKLLTKIGRKREALALLTRAHEISPKNIDRLSFMGDLEVSLRDPMAAIKYFQTALGLDSKDLKSQVGLKVAQNFSVLVDLQVSGTKEDPSISKLINNLGVQLAKNGSFEKAMKYYLISFAFLGEADLQSKVSFNLGLGFKKWGKSEQAKFWLEKALTLSNGLYEKAERHLEGMQHIQAKPGFGTPQPVKIAPPPVALPKVLPVQAPPTLIADINSKTLENESFLFEEETMYGVGVKKDEPLVKASLDKMIADIDVDLGEVDDLTFDEAS